MAQCAVYAKRCLLLNVMLASSALRSQFRNTGVCSRAARPLPHLNLAKDYAARQRKWLDFVSDRGRGREATPTYDPAYLSWRHLRVNPPPDLDYFLIEDPMYKGVEGLPGPSVPPRSAFDPYAEGAALPQQVVWNHQKAMGVLNASKTTLKQFDASKQCKPVDPPVSVRLLKGSIAEDPRAGSCPN